MARRHVRWRVEARRPGGQGTETFPDGQKYEGDWKNDEWNGYGTYVSPNGWTHTGEWKDHTRAGKGTRTQSDVRFRRTWYGATERHGLGRTRRAPDRVGQWH